MNDRLDPRRRALAWQRPLLLTAIMVFILSGCADLPIAIGNAPKEGAATGAREATASATAQGQTATQSTGLPAGSPRPADGVTAIALGDTITVDGPGASAAGGTVRITAGGTYSISGMRRNGQIIVDSEDEETVKLVFNGVDITHASSTPPLYVRRPETTVIALADGTVNRIVDGGSPGTEDPAANEANAAIFSKGNLTFAGNGSLTVVANHRHGISSKDLLNFTGGNITVNAANDGIRGRDHIVVKNGVITVNAQADGMQSDNDEDPGRGLVAIEGGTVNITAGQDGIQAETSVVIKGGATTVTSGGGSANGRGGKNTPEHPPADSASPVSAKGIKAVTDVKIEGGTVTVDSSDDAINSGDSVTIDDGKIVLASGEKGINADYAVTINGGDTSVTKSYEAIEGAVVTINGGNLRLAADDDGVSVTGSIESTNGRLGRDPASVDEHLAIAGGYIVIDVAGDGLDIGGWAKMTAGTIIVNGPSNDNSALDFDREFTMAGGTLVAVGSSGVAQAPDATSTQYSLMVHLGSPQPAGTLVHIAAEDGTGIITFAPTKQYQSVVFSSPELKKGSTYNVYVGGSATGSVVDGVYSGGSYTPGTPTARATI